MARSTSRARTWTVRLLLGAVALLAVAGVSLAVAAAGVYLALLRDLPDLHSLADYRPALTSVVLDRKGRPIGEFFEQRRQLTRLADVPPHVVQAFIAAEDDTFYEHRGIDLQSILRAAWTNLLAHGETIQGASTITQQIVKRLLLSSERTYTRKIREMILARRLEQRFSKDEILFLYLNEIYLGNGAYGVAEATRTYFGKPLAEITLSEAALLAGLPKAPSRYSPTRNPARAEERRRYVLQRMYEEGFIDARSYAALLESPPELAAPPEREAFAAAAYPAEEVRRQLVDRLGSELVLRGGLNVETTIDLELQQAAQQAVRNGLEALDQRHGWRGPLRHVPATELSAEIARLGHENGLGTPSGPALPAEGVWLGVVTSVSDEQARVAFAPGLEAVVALADVAWARRRLAHGSGNASAMEQVFAVGDVASFRRSPGDAAGADVPRATLYQHPQAQGALLAFEVEGGDVLALVGGYDFEESEFDRATQARRQPGSAFKPIIYGTAIASGFTPATMLYDRPVVYEDPYTGVVWRPENYDHRFRGPLLMSEALARSLNSATIHLLSDIGVERVVDYARRLGIRSPLDPYLSLALGSSAVSLLELTRAYAVFPSGGRLVRPRLVSRVLDRRGRVLLEDLPLEDRSGAETAQSHDAASQSPSSERVMPLVEAYLMTDLLRNVVEHPHGTAHRARSLGRPVAGKTGTTNEQADAWFIGFSPEVVAGAWVGHDERHVLGHGETGGRAALPIWMEFMEAALPRYTVQDFRVPEGIVFARIDTKTGRIASGESDGVQFQAFAEGNLPTTSSAEPAPAAASETRRRLRLGF